MSRHRASLWIAVRLISLAAVTGVAAETNQTTAIIVALKSDPYNPSLLAQLKAALPSVANRAERCAPGVIYCLGSFAAGDTANGATYRVLLLKNFAGDPATAAVADASTLDTCTRCDHGAVPLPCPRCNPTEPGTCPVCRGSGTSLPSDLGGTTAERVKRIGDPPCKRCNGAGKCLVCGGTGTAKVRCAACEGLGMAVSPAKCRAAYLALLADYNPPAPVPPSSESDTPNPPADTTAAVSPDAPPPQAPTPGSTSADTTTALPPDAPATASPPLAVPPTADVPPSVVASPTALSEGLDSPALPAPVERVNPTTPTTSDPPVSGETPADQPRSRRRPRAEDPNVSPTALAKDSTTGDPRGAATPPTSPRQRERSAESPAIQNKRQAAEQGDVAAQYALGVAYSEGEGVAQDFTEAAKWYRKAAEQGFAPGQFNLGLCYSDGRGVQKDDRIAYRWYLLSAKGGSKGAAAVLSGVEAKLSKVERAEARDWVRNWNAPGAPRRKAPSRGLIIGALAGILGLVAGVTLLVRRKCRSSSRERPVDRQSTAQTPIRQTSTLPPAPIAAPCDLIFKCPHCTKSLAIPESAAGRTCPCTDCGVAVTIPFPGTRFACPACHHPLSAPAALVDAPVQCPECQSEIIVPALLVRATTSGAAAAKSVPPSAARDAHTAETSAETALLNVRKLDTCAVVGEGNKLMGLWFRTRVEATDKNLLAGVMVLQEMRGRPTEKSDFDACRNGLCQVVPYKDGYCVLFPSAQSQTVKDLG